MTGKWIGAILVICGCGGVGFSIAASYRREECALRRLMNALEFMECELRCHLTPLPELCRQTARESSGTIAGLFSTLARELDSQVAPDVQSCLRAARMVVGEIPGKVGQAWDLLGSTLGRFDLEGQIQGLETVRAFCRRELETLSRNRESRLRSYQTLGLCAGAALAILFV